MQDAHNTLQKTAGELTDSDVGSKVTWLSSPEGEDPETFTITLGRVQHCSPNPEFNLPHTIVEDSVEHSLTILADDAVLAVSPSAHDYVRVTFTGRPGSVLYEHGRLWSGAINDQATQARIEQLLGVGRLQAPASASLPNVPQTLQELREAMGGEGR